MKSGASKLNQGTFRRIAAALLAAFVLLLPARAEAAGTAADETRVRVKLSVGSISELTVDVEGQYACGDTVFVGGTLTVRARNGEVRIRHSELGELARGESVSVLRREETVWAAFLSLDNTRYGRCRYQGDLLFFTDGDDRLTAVNRVGMRAYLYGVVGGELRNTHPIEALKAQAVAAKCFALTCLDPAEPYDVDDTPTDQVYKGYHPAHENVIAAVDEVADDLLLYEGDVVRCYYCTSNGGQTITPLMRWGNNSEQNAVFTMAYDPYDLEHAGDAVQLHILPDVHTLPAELQGMLLRLAQAQNADIAAVDTILSLVGLHDPADPDGSYDAPAALAPQTQIEATLACRTADGMAETAQIGFPFDAFLTEGILSAPEADTWFLRAEDDGSWTVVFSHAVGHRVGMSHEGLLGRAEAGFTYDEILACYYPGATLLHGGEPDPTATPAPTAPPSATPPTPTATPEPALIPYEEPPSLWVRIFGGE